MEQTVYQRAIEKWGPDFQIDMAIEECAELILALRHYGRGRAHIADVQNEIADVEIMIEQLKIIFGNTIAYKELKLKRLEKRLAE